MILTYKNMIASFTRRKTIPRRRALYLISLQQHFRVVPRRCGTKCGNLAVNFLQPMEKRLESFLELVVHLTSVLHFGDGGCQTNDIRIEIRRNRRHHLVRGKQIYSSWKHA